jgi:glyoxylase-like metal-dependent hydrolase (beta-lactamase superfamily II)
LSFDGKLSLDSFEKDAYKVIHLPGHSPGGIGILIHSPEREQAILLAGDNILAPITPHPDDLLRYLRTLNKLTTLNNVALVLPGHGDAIFDFKKRLTELQQHHRQRLKFTYELCQNETSIWQIATTPGYFDVPVDPEKFNPLAGHEAFIHVEMLDLANGVSRTDIKNGVHYFTRSGERFEDVYERVLAIVADEQATVLMRR